MITVKFTVTEYLAEYLYAKYNNHDFTAPIRLPDNSDLYHVLYDLTSKPPSKLRPSSGNVELILPHRDRGKQPDTYNCVSAKSAKIFARHVKNIFNAELHDFIDEKYHRRGMLYSEAVNLFVNKYGLTAIGEDAIRKNYYRWKERRKKYRQSGYDVNSR